MSTEQSIGDKIATLFTKGCGALFSLFIAALIFVVPASLVWLDLFLGPQFMTAYIDETGLYSGWLADTIPWVLSIATTGFQYMLFVSIRGGAKFKKGDNQGNLALLLGWGVTILDTAIDVGGFTSLAYGDPAIGMQIIPDNPDGGWILVAVLIAIGCGGQEFILSPALKREKGKKLPISLPAAGVIRISLNVTGTVYEIFCGVARGIAMLSVFTLDVFLSYFFLQSTFGEGGVLEGTFQVVAWFIALSLTVGQFLAYLQYKKSKADGGDDGGMGFGGGGKKKKLNPWMLGGAVLAIIDTAMDIGGFTIMMYGPDQSGLGIFPDDPSRAWVILALIIVGMCMLYESLMEAVFTHGLTKTLKGV